jgi:hypothetical protein
MSRCLACCYSRLSSYRYLLQRCRAGAACERVKHLSRKGQCARTSREQQCGNTHMHATEEWFLSGR